MISVIPNLREDAILDAELTHEERRVILSSKAELARSLGTKRDTDALTDPRLETHRRYAIFYRLLGGATAREHVPLELAGFSQAEIDAIPAVIAEEKSAVTRRWTTAFFSYGALVFAAAMLFLVYLFCAEYFGSSLFAMVATCILGVTIAPLVIPSGGSGRRYDQPKKRAKKAAPAPVDLAYREHEATKQLGHRKSGQQSEEGKHKFEAVDLALLRLVMR